MNNIFRELLREKEFFVYSLSLTNYLVRKGHDIIKVKDNVKYPMFKVFIFRNTPKIHTDMESYYLDKGIG